MRAIMQQPRFFLAITIWMSANIVLGIGAILIMYLIPQKKFRTYIRFWAGIVLKIMVVLGGTKYTITGTIPKGGVLLASKHQSMWETMALVALLPNPTMVMKKELFYIPLFGWICARAGMIGIKRGGGKQTVTRLIEKAKTACANGEQVVIFPEGTRKLPNAKPHYKAGIGIIYEKLALPCVPLAHNSGTIWNKKSLWLIQKTGVISVIILPPIKAGLGREDFMKKLQASIEGAMQKINNP